MDKKSPGQPAPEGEILLIHPTQIPGHQWFDKHLFLISNGCPV